MPSTEISTPTETNDNKQLAALDLGSNSFHLVVAQETRGAIQVLDKHKEMVRLAEGLNDQNELDQSVVDRALDCLARFAERLRPISSENVRVVGTNTLRKVNKSTNFIEQAELILGHRVEVISGYEEARLIYLGVCHDLGIDERARLVIDIGGGSTEIIVGRQAVPELLESLHIGCVSMSRAHFAKGKISKLAMQSAINEALAELEPVAQEFLRHGWHASVGASGTINAVLNVAVNMDPGTTQITPEHLNRIQEALISAGNVSKLDLPGLADERRPVFAGGVAILTAIFRALKIDQMSAAQSALREGLIYDLLGRQHEDDTRDRTVRGLIQRHGIDERHAQKVRETAISLYSQVAADWDITQAAHKRLLNRAASLHEIGRSISHSGYHKHGAYLLEHLDMPGFSRLDQQLVATLVRHHRRKLGADALRLKDPEQLPLLRLTVLLRLAALLNRSRSGESLPHFGLKVSDEEMHFQFPKKWLRNHPLMSVDLKNEANYLKSVGLKLDVAGSEN